MNDMKINIVTKLTSAGILLGISSQMQAQENNRPNIIVILADDMGYSDIGCYGGEIQTSNLNRLAENGIRFSRFYNTSRSCPTRASLLTGLYQHQAGVGDMTDNKFLPGYKGQLSRNAVTIAEVLKSKGYQTGMLGKWHLSETTTKPDQVKWANHQVYYPDFADRGSYPTKRGFDDFYGIIWGAADYFDPFSLVNGEEPVREVPKDYYFTQALSDSAVSYVNRYVGNKEPFFLYIAYNAPHYPLHALPEDIAKYEDTYKVGWDVIRNQRYQSILDKKIFGDRTGFLTAKDAQTPVWSANATKDWDARAMAVHAAMVDRMDQGIGQIIDALEKNGELDNTLIMFLSDNGCCNERAETYGPGTCRPGETRDGTPIIYPGDAAKKAIAFPGPQTTYAGISRGWTNVSNTPFRLWKSKTAEGGICTPMIAHWPAGIKANVGKITEQMGHVMDIMATCLDIAGASYPEMYNGNAIIPMEGKSLAPIFITGERDGHDQICFEHEKAKAIITKDLWKLVQPEANPTVWELYNLNVDRTEMNNLAKTYPAKVTEMNAAYEAWTKRCMVKPAPGDPLDGPVAIANAGGLDYIRAYMDGEFYLTADITLPDAEWLPFGSKSNTDNNPGTFKGVFDGRGYTIKNLHISTPANFKGLFARLEYGTVKNLNLEVNIKGGDRVGGLAGAMYSASAIERVSIKGNVEGTGDWIGGLVGRVANSTTSPGSTTYNTIKDCYVNANVKSTTNVGGITGTNDHYVKLENVYFAGKVEAGSGKAGGIIGSNNTAKAQAKAIAVVADELNGGLTAYFCNGNKFESQDKLYARNDIECNKIPNGAGAAVTPEMLLMPEIFSTQTFYENTLRWNFTNNWEMLPAEKYPVLRSNYQATSINKKKTHPLFSVYSASGGILVSTEKEINLTIFNMQAQVIYAENNIHSTTYIPLSYYNLGVYVVKIACEGKSYIQKIII